MRWLTRCSATGVVRSRSKVHRVGWLSLVLGCAVACADTTEPTQVVVLVEASAALRPSIENLRVQLDGIRSDDSVDPVTLPDMIPTIAWPVKFVLTPRAGDVSRRYRLRISAVDREGRGRAKVTLASSYVRNETRYVRVRLAEGCEEADLRPDVWTFGRTRDSALLITCGDEETDAGASDTGPVMPEDAMTDAPDTAPPEAAPEAGTTDCDPPCGTNQLCVRRGDELACNCAPGFVERDDGACEAASACTQFYCEQDCVVVGGQPECRCIAGSKLNADGRTCYRPKWLPLDPVARALPGALAEPAFDVLQVSLAASGSAAVVWYRIEDASYVAYVSRFQRGVGWSAASRSEPAAMSSNYRPDFALNGDGDALAAWTRTTPEPDRAIVARSPRGYPWEAEVVSKGPHSAASPLVATDAAGAATVLWSESDQGTWALWSSSAVKDKDWSAPAVVPPSVMNSTYPALLEMNEAGRAFVVWDPPPSGTQTPIVASFRDANGTWLASEAFDSFYFEIPIENWAADYLGDVAAVVGEMPVSMIDWELRASVHRQGQGWVAPKMLQSSNARAYSYNPDVAVSPNGSVFAVWNQGTIAAQEILATRYDPATGWSELRVIGEGSYPHVAALAGGDAIAVWNVPARKQILFSRYIASVDAWLAEDVVHAGVEVKSEIGLDAAGERAIIAFVGTDGTSETLWSAHFE